jgi:hypothetical protein
MAVGAVGAVGEAALPTLAAGGNFKGPFWPQADSINTANIASTSDARLRTDFSIQEVYRP